jgi:PAS domain S-box-containing protein
MNGFLTSQLDYIFFIYGLSFFVIALACIGMGKPGRSHLPWALLGAFGVTHGLSEWFDLVAYSLGDNLLFAVVRLAFMAVSFFFLLEFGREGMRRIGRNAPGMWIHAALAVAALALGGSYGLPGLNASARYFLGLTGGLYSGYFLVTAWSKDSDTENHWLALAGVFIGAYGIATGLVTPKAGFFPASFLNYDSVIDATGIPIQLVRAALAALAALFIIAYYRAGIIKKAGVMTMLARTVYTYKPVLVVIVIVAAGWFLTEGVGRRDIKDFKRLHLSWTRTVASSFMPEHVYALGGQAGGYNEKDYDLLRERLIQIRRENPECRSAVLRTLRGGRFVLMADGEHDGSAGHRDYGYPLGTASPDEAAEYDRGTPSVWETRVRSAVTGIVVAVPIHNDKGETLAQLVMDFDASAAHSSVKEDRLSIIAVTCALSFFGIAAFIAWYRTRESLAQAAELELAAYVMENEKKLRAVTSALGEGVLQLDGKGSITFMNPEAERLLGYAENELIGLDGHDMLHRYTRDGSHTRRDNCPSLTVLKTGRTVRAEEELFTRKDGTSFPVSYVSAPVYTKGVVTGVVVAFQDITSRKKAEEAIIKSEYSYRTLSENLPGIVYRITLGEKNDMHFFNDMVVPMTGFSADELGGEGICSLESRIFEDDLPRVLNAVNIAIMECSSFQMEYRFRHRDKGIRYFMERGRAIKGEDGKAAHIDGVILDVTERRRAETELYKFKFIVEGAGEEFYLVDTSGRFEYANEAACRSLGYTLDELRQRNIADVDPTLSAMRFESHLQSLRKKELPPFETEYITRDGRRIPKEVKSSRLFIEGREYVCGIVRDITERKELERQRTDFFGIVTHDLKSPLSVIHSYADLILTDFTGAIPGEVTDACEGIRKSCDKVLALVDDYLAISRLESGVMRMGFSDVDVKELLYEAAVTAKALASAKGIDVKVEACETARSIRADQGYMIRALVNLVQNAVNYTPQGGAITLACGMEMFEGVRHVFFAVTDSGPGIDPQERDKIFEKYYRSPKTRGVKGSGLGLTIVRAVAEAHGGAIQLESEPGRGSTFRILVPEK